MPEILRDPLWQFVGALFAFAAILLTFFLYLLQRSRKALSYEVTSRTQLLSIREEIKGRLQILFDGNVVRDVHMVVIKVLNSGNVPIVPSDYERPVQFDFGENVRILSAEVIETHPENIEASVNIVSEKVVLMPVLLNGGDSITLKVLLGQFDGKIDVDGRIIGVKQVQMAKESSLPDVMLVAGCAMIIGAGLLTDWSPLPERPGWVLARVGMVPLILFLFGSILTLVGLISSKGRVLTRLLRLPSPFERD